MTQTAKLVKYDMSKLVDDVTFNDFNIDIRGEIMWIWIVDTNIRIDTLGTERDEKLQVEK